eukprot:ANDGO_01589.mRNA.1 hypothetical protein NAEGRDRAFT_80839
MIHSTSIAEFDIDVGNTLSVVYPLRAFDCCALSLNYIADHCLPDGGHAFTSDSTYFTLSREEFFKRPVPSDAPSELFGFAYFVNVRDETVRRGAVQKSIVVISSYRMTDMFIPLYKACMDRFMTSPSVVLLQHLYEGIHKAIVMQSTSVTLFQKLEDVAPFHMHIVLPPRDEWTQISVKDFVKRFGTDVLYIRSALLLKCRVMIVGTPAFDVCNAVIASLYLLGDDRLMPPTPFSPHVCLADMDRIIGASAFLYGTTNRLFEERKDWADVVVSFESNKVIFSESSAQKMEIKKNVSSAARRRLRYVVSGIQEGRSESWVRVQVGHLAALDRQDDGTSPMSELGAAGGSPSALAAPGSGGGGGGGSMLRQRFSEHLERDAQAIIKELLTRKEELGQLDRRKLLYELYKKCSTQGTWSQANPPLTVPTSPTPAPSPAGSSPSFAVVGSPAASSPQPDLLSATVEVPLSCILGFLDDQSAQVRKYALSLLSPWAAMVILNRVVKFLNDPMPNVVNSAALVLLRISDSPSGARLIAQDPEAVEFLICALMNDEDDMEYRSRACSVLRNVFASCSRRNQKLSMFAGVEEEPLLDLPTDHDKTSPFFFCQPPNIMTLSRLQDLASRLKSGPRSKLSDSLLLLLDEWSTNLDGLVPSEGVRERIQDLSFPDLDVMTGCASSLLMSVNLDRILLLQCIHSDVVSILLMSITLRSGEHQLCRLSYALLSLVADTNYGCRKISERKGVQRVVHAMQCGSNSPLLLLSICRFFASCCSHSELASEFHSAGGIRQICLLLSAVSHLPHMAVLSRAATRVLAELYCLDRDLYAEPIRSDLRDAFVADDRACRFIEEEIVNFEDNHPDAGRPVSASSPRAPVPQEVLDLIRSNRMKDSTESVESSESLPVPTSRSRTRSTAPGSRVASRNLRFLSIAPTAHIPLQKSPRSLSNAADANAVLSPASLEKMSKEPWRSVLPPRMRLAQVQQRTQFTMFGDFVLQFQTVLSCLGETDAQ